MTKLSPTNDPQTSKCDIRDVKKRWRRTEHYYCLRTIVLRILLQRDVKQLISRAGYGNSGAYRIALTGRAVIFAFGLGAKLKPPK